MNNNSNSDAKTNNRFSIRIKYGKPDVIDFLNLQGNINDAISYLIEKEIAENGLRNLESFIPVKREKEFFKTPGNINTEKKKDVNKKNIVETEDEIVKIDETENDDKASENELEVYDEYED
jgi:hypothetical protein